MFNYVLNRQVPRHDFILTFLCMSYIAMVISSIVLFEIILKINFFGMLISLPGAIVPYVFLYPISFIILRVYGIESINNTIGSTILVALVFVLMAKWVAALSFNHTFINEVLSSSFKMYLAGFIGMPAGMYASFLTINLLAKIGLPFNGLSLTIATAIGEIINTIIVFPIGLHGSISMSEIFNKMITDALIFKISVGAFLAFLSVHIINIIIYKKLNAA